MVIRQITFSLVSSRESEFRDFWMSSYYPAMAAQPGFIQARLLKLKEGEGDFQIEIEFENEDAAAKWRSCSDHERLKPTFKAFIPASTLKVYEHF